ncbi:PIR Superfamily Protein [Plasmodium ovale curtisi]|uniref:PIR Superfamily Protein n=1 Tax=Plasmodium ovale curtisi TaxID=864141 RepID=A0A1A8WKS0_PLAOA|nr:PIR Superfamily Protein [Plasmodium ovale curtisi]
MGIFDDSNYFSFNELKEQYDFLRNTNFGKIYDVFNDTEKYDEAGRTFYSQIKDNLSYPYDNEEIISKFCNIIYKISVKINDNNNENFDGIDKDDKLFCFSLKYWLYDQIRNIGRKGLNIDKLFQQWKNNMEAKINNRLSVPCTINELSWEEYSKLKSIYAFKLLFHKNIKDFHEKQYVDCKYINFFGKGLNEYYHSVKQCSKEPHNIYCKEFNEFNNIYNEDYTHFKTTKEDHKYMYFPEDILECALEIKSSKNPIQLSYWNEMQRFHFINYLSNSPQSTIISASSVIGATVGISTFLLYLYKYTSLGSIFLTRKQKDNVNSDNIYEETLDFTESTSEFEPTHFKNSDYKISYYSLNNS